MALATKQKGMERRERSFVVISSSRDKKRLSRMIRVRWLLENCLEEEASSISQRPNSSIKLGSLPA